MTRGRFWATALALAVIAAFAVKLYVVTHSNGTLDVAYCFDYLNQIRHCGACIYASQFQLPPFMIHGLRGLGALADWTGWRLEFWVRFPNILADVAAAYLMWRIVARYSASLFLMVLAPASIMISGYHGNTDPFMMFLVLLAIDWARVAPVWAAGAALGMAINIKVAPVILIPASAR